MNNFTRFNAAEAEDLIFELSESEDFDEVLCSESKSDMTTISPLLPFQQLLKLMPSLKTKLKAVKMTPINPHAKKT